MFACFSFCVVVSRLSFHLLFGFPVGFLLLDLLFLQMLVNLSGAILST